MSSECLRALHYIRAGGVAFAAHCEFGLGTLHLDAGVEQDVDELRRGEEVWLIRGQDVATWIAQGRIAEEAVEFLRIAAATPSASSPFPSLEENSRGAGGLHDFGRDRPAIAVAVLDGVLAHEPNVVEELF